MGDLTLGGGERLLRDVVGERGAVRRGETERSRDDAVWTRLAGEMPRRRLLSAVLMLLVGDRALFW